jgi:hypothetical protein
MTTEARRTFATRIDIPEETRQELVDLLNAHVADTINL